VASSHFGVGEASALRRVQNMDMARFVVALVAIAVCVSGCGGNDKQSKADKAAMNAEFAKIDFHIAQTTMGPGYAKEKLLEQATRRYAATIHKYRDELGDAEANRRLSHEAEQVGPFCPPCVEILRREADAS
jgi:hypothetical protein